MPDAAPRILAQDVSVLCMMPTSDSRPLVLMSLANEPEKAYSGKRQVAGARDRTACLS